MKTETDKIERDDNASGGDWGDIYNITCPNCDRTVRVAEERVSEWPCECGLYWQANISITAHGFKKDR